MYSENFMIYAVAVLSFFLSFGGFYYLSLRNEELEPSKNTPFLIMLPVLAAAFLFLFSQLSDQRDFIFSLKLEQLLFPLGASAVIYFGSRFQASAVYAYGCYHVLFSRSFFSAAGRIRTGSRPQFPVQRTNPQLNPVFVFGFLSLYQ